ncbi:MAG: DUF1134 domain-containing protein [Sphingomonas sp.]
MDRLMLWAAAAALGLGAVPAAAQVTTIDPNSAIDSDIDPPAPRREAPPANDPYDAPARDNSYRAPPAARQAAPAASMTDVRRQATNTFQRDDLIGAAEGVFGKGAAGAARIIENILRDQGEPNAYIAGREAAGALVVGLRYGSGQMFHKVEGERPVYWTGPSVGFDVGGDATKVFVLVYNLYDSQELYRRFPAGEGRAYLIGGFSATYLRRGNVVLIPIRLGVGWRLGVNAGYMKFTERKKWMPF